MQLTEITSWKEIPHFATVEEEAEYWKNHSINPRLIEASLLTADNRESTTITLRFDPRMLARIKRVARSQYLNYQSMMKQWLAERLNEEARKGPDQDIPLTR